MDLKLAYSKKSKKLKHLFLPMECSQNQTILIYFDEIYYFLSLARAFS